VAPEQGWARLAPKNAKTFRCLEPAATRCTSSKDGQCAPGYAGPLCISCAEGSHSAGHLCKPCAAGPRKRALGAALVLGVAGLAIAGFVWRRRASESEPSAGVPDAKKAALALLVSQGPLLLQLGQLWVVVAKLGTTKLDTKAEKGFAVAFWEQPYVQWLQLSAQGLQDALSLECSYGSAQTRFWGAVLSPLAPLSLLALCGLVELFSRSSGISLAIKALTLFFIGGATSCAQLLSCQDTDGGGNLLGEHAFRLAMPELKCSEPSWVDGVGWLCALAYGVLIPACLLGLMVKQHVALRASRTTTALAILDGDQLLIRSHEFRTSFTTDVKEKKDRMFEKNILAAAVAHATVLFRGNIRLQMQKGGMTLEVLDKDQPALNALGRLNDMLAIQSSADAQRCSAITRMLMERCILREVEGSDRILAGVKNLLTKYVWCQDVWVEIMMRLATVALVSAASLESVGFSVGIALVVGVMVGTLQPYTQRQVNDLQCCCFLCLAAAAAGFGLHLVWLARFALALPFLVACCQMRHPDCPEALALRLFEALEPRLAEAEALEVVVEDLSL